MILHQAIHELRLLYWGQTPAISSTPRERTSQGKPSEKWRAALNPYRSLIPTDGCLVQIDENIMLRLKVSIQSPRTELAPVTGLLVATPGGLYISRLQVIHTYNSGAQGFHGSSGSEESSVHTAAAKPYGVSFAMRIASDSLSKEMTAPTGPKISSRAIRALLSRS